MRGFKPPFYARIINVEYQLRAVKKMLGWGESFLYNRIKIWYNSIALQKGRSVNSALDEGVRHLREAGDEV